MWARAEAADTRAIDASYFFNSASHKADGEQAFGLSCNLQTKKKKRNKIASLEESKLDRAISHESNEVVNDIKFQKPTTL